MAIPAPCLKSRGFHEEFRATHRFSENIAAEEGDLGES